MPKTATLTLTGIIVPNDWIWPGESGISLLGVQRAIEAAGEFDDLTMFINSEGGIIEEGWAIYDYLLSLNKPITAIGLGAVYSMATVLMLSGSTRLLSAHTKFMIHLPGGGVMGNRLDMQQYLDELIAEEKRIVDVYTATTGKDESEIAGILADGKDHYYTADEALAYGWTTGIYQTATPATALRNRQPIMAHASAGRKGLNLPEHQPAVPAPVATTTHVKTPGVDSPIIDMTKLTNRLGAAWSAIKAVMEGEPLKNLSVDTADGKKLKIETTGDSYVVGDAVTNDDDTPVADGDYILSDGNTITVAGGTISAITEPEEDKEDAATPEAPATASAEGEQVTISKAEFDRLKALDTEVTALKTKQGEHDKLIARLKPLADHLAKQESADPITARLPETPIEKRVPVADSPLERKREIDASRKK